MTDKGEYFITKTGFFSEYFKELGADFFNGHRHTKIAEAVDDYQKAFPEDTTSRIDLTRIARLYAPPSPPRKRSGKKYVRRSPRQW